MKTTARTKIAAKAKVADPPAEVADPPAEDPPADPPAKDPPAKEPAINVAQVVAREVLVAMHELHEDLHRDARELTAAPKVTDAVTPAKPVDPPAAPEAKESSSTTTDSLTAGNAAGNAAVFHGLTHDSRGGNPYSFKLNTDGFYLDEACKPCGKDDRHKSLRSMNGLSQVQAAVCRDLAMLWYMSKRAPDTAGKFNFTGYDSAAASDLVTACTKPELASFDDVKKTLKHAVLRGDIDALAGQLKPVNPAAVVSAAKKRTVAAAPAGTPVSKRQTVKSVDPSVLIVNAVVLELGKFMNEHAVNNDACQAFVTKCMSGVVPARQQLDMLLKSLESRNEMLVTFTLQAIVSAMQAQADAADADNS